MVLLSSLVGPGMKEAVGKEGGVNQHAGQKPVPDTRGIQGMSTHGGCKPTRDTWSDIQATLASGKQRRVQGTNL